MSMLDEMGTRGPAGDDAEYARREIAREGWRWFREHEGDRIVTVRLLVVTVRVRVGQLRPLFVALFGPEPKEGGTLGAYRGVSMRMGLVGTVAVAGLLLASGCSDAGDRLDPPVTLDSPRVAAVETVGTVGAVEAGPSGEHAARGTGVLGEAEQHEPRAKRAGKRAKRGESAAPEPACPESEPFVIELGRVDSTGNCIVGYMTNGWYAVSGPGANCRRELEDIERLLMGDGAG